MLFDMKAPLKKLVYRYAAAMLLVSGYLLLPGNRPENPEARLSQANGKERILLLEELSKACRVDNPKKSLQYSKEALEMLNESPDPDPGLRVKVLDSIANAFRIAGNNRDALDYAESSLRIARQINDRTAIAAAILTMGKVYFQVGEKDKAIENYEKSLKILEELKKPAEIAEINTLMGIFKNEKGEYADAVRLFLKAGKIYEELNDRKGVAWTTNYIGETYGDLKNYDKSLEYFLKSLKLKEELQNNVDIAVALKNIGSIYTEKKMYSNALDYFQRALRITRGTGNKQLLSLFYIRIGNCYQELKSYGSALDYYKRSLAIKEEYQDKEGIAEADINIAAIYRHTGKYEEAIRLAKSGLDISLKMDLKARIRDAYQVLSETYESLGDFQKALLFHQRFLELNDVLLDVNTAKKIIGLELDFELEKEQKRIDLLEIEQKNQRTIRYYLILAILLAVALSTVIYTRYRLKARLTRDLEKENEEHRQTEIKLRESEEKFRVLAEKSVLGIRIIQDNVIAYANPRAAEIFAYPLAEMINQNPVELAVEEDRSGLAQYLDMAGGWVGGSPRAYEYRVQTRKKETIHLESYGAPILYRGRPALMESIIDCTSRKIAEAELIKTGKMEAAGLLAGGIAHDFNNLLAIILGNNSLLKIYCGHLDPDYADYLDSIEKSSVQAAELAQKFLTFSTGEAVLRKKVKLSAILTAMTAYLQGKGAIPFRASIPPDLEPIYGDVEQLGQVFANLLLNAQEATSGNNHGEITLEAENITLGKGNPFFLGEGKYVRVSVTDNGRGIADDVQEKIFDPYFSTKGAVTQKGLGLGLPICYAIIKKHEGHINLASAVDKGTTVDLYLPAYVGE